MPHVAQDRYSKLVLAKLRDTLVLKDGVVFNNDYEGKPSAGVVILYIEDVDLNFVLKKICPHRRCHPLH